MFDLTDFCTRCPQKDSCLPQDQTGIFCFVDERVTTTPRSKLVCVRVRRLNIFKMYKQTYYVTGGLLSKSLPPCFILLIRLKIITISLFFFCPRLDIHVLVFVCAHQRVPLHPCITRHDSCSLFLIDQSGAPVIYLT